MHLVKRALQHHSQLVRHLVYREPALLTVVAAVLVVVVEAALLSVLAAVLVVVEAALLPVLAVVLVMVEAAIRGPNLHFATVWTTRGSAVHPRCSLHSQRPGQRALQHHPPSYS